MPSTSGVPGERTRKAWRYSMSDILGSIFETEEKAKAMVEEARKRQAERRSRIEAESAERLGRVREEVRELIKESVRAEREKADARLQEAYGQDEKGRLPDGRQEDAALEPLVGEITRLILSPEYARR